jgi:hypothetical protein
MALVQLECAKIGSLNKGAAEHIVNAAIKEAITDLDDRGADGKPRQVHIIIELRQLDEGKGPTVAHVEACAKVPRRRTGGHAGQLIINGKQATFEFREHNPDDPRQQTIEDDYEDGRRA